MAVTESYQGRGIGRLLLQAVVDAARAGGARHMRLETNRALGPAIALYQAFGFRHATPPLPSPFARSDVYMELDLS